MVISESNRKISWPRAQWQYLKYALELLLNLFEKILIMRALKFKNDPYIKAPKWAPMFG